MIGRVEVNKEKCREDAHRCKLRRCRQRRLRILLLNYLRNDIRVGDPLAVPEVDNRYLPLRTDLQKPVPPSSDASTGDFRTNRTYLPHPTENGNQTTPDEETMNFLPLRLLAEVDQPRFIGNILLLQGQEDLLAEGTYFQFTRY